MDALCWDSDPAGRQITDGEIDVWLICLDLEDSAGALLATLSPDERQRADRRRSALDGRRYAIGRACLRSILGRYLAMPAGRLRFRIEPHGRPVLDPSAELSFSASHAGAIGLVAVACAGVGVDLEPTSTARQIANFADRYMPADCVAKIRAAPAEVRNEEWVGLWTELEARAKLDGRGLADLDPISTAALLRLEMHVVRFGPAPGYIGTLAHGGQKADVSYFAFEPIAVESTMPGTPQGHSRRGLGSVT